MIRPTPSATRTATLFPYTTLFRAVRDEHANGSGASTSEGTYARSGVFARGSRADSSSVSTEDSLALAKPYSGTARRLDELSQQLSRDASYAETQIGRAHV